MIGVSRGSIAGGKELQLLLLLLLLTSSSHDRLHVTSRHNHIFLQAASDPHRTMMQAEVKRHVKYFEAYSQTLRESTCTWDYGHVAVEVKTCITHELELKY